MEIVEIELERDLPEIQGWYALRTLPVPNEEYFPINGFICHGIGAGFLMRSDTVVGFLEHFITNPEAPATDRHRCMDAIAGKLIAAGKEDGIKVFMAITSHPYIFKLCDKYGLLNMPEMKVFGRSEV